MLCFFERGTDGIDANRHPFRRFPHPDEGCGHDSTDRGNDIFRGETFADFAVFFRCADHQGEGDITGALYRIPGSCNCSLCICPGVGVVDDGKTVTGTNLHAARHSGKGGERGGIEAQHHCCRPGESERVAVSGAGKERAFEFTGSPVYLDRAGSAGDRCNIVEGNNTGAFPGGDPWGEENPLAALC